MWDYDLFHSKSVTSMSQREELWNAGCSNLNWRADHGKKRECHSIRSINLQMETCHSPFLFFYFVFIFHLFIFFMSEKCFQTSTWKWVSAEDHGIAWVLSIRCSINMASLVSKAPIKLDGCMFTLNISYNHTFPSFW